MNLHRAPARGLSAVLLGAVCAAALTIALSSSSARAARAATATACAAGTNVQTTYGPVCGTTSGTVDEWLGIPYAAPPVGPLRWAPPQPPTPWTTTLAGTSFGSQCAQYFPLFSPNVTGSEDCLFVNVWRPADTSSGLPVMVHIHGGGFVIGSGNGDNTLLANTGHEVIVSLNYRLGIFGFLADNSFGPHSGDYGLQDQQAALRWVHNNISAFGGDPQNVTIFGESAGGSSVCDQIASPTAKRLFEHGISTSGEYNTLLGAPTPLETQDCKSRLPSKGEAFAAGGGFATAVGCGHGTADVASCLRAVSIDQAEKVSGLGYQDGGRGTVSPTINGTTLTMTLRQALRTSHVNRVDVIAGTDRDENLVGTATTASDYQNLVDTQYGIHAAEVLARYPLNRFDSPGLAWRTVAADSDTVCPSLQTDRDLAARMPVYAYEIDDNDLPPYTVGGTAFGASHVGAWYLDPVNPPLDANQQVLQNQEVAYVTTFARTGNPTTSGAPVWPRFSRGDQPVISLQPAGDTEVVSAAELSAQHNCAFWDRLAPNR